MILNPGEASSTITILSGIRFEVVSCNEALHLKRKLLDPYSCVFDDDYAVSGVGLEELDCNEGVQFNDK